MTLFEFLRNSGFADGEFIFVNLDKADPLPYRDMGYKGTLRNIPFRLLRCMVKDYEVKDHYVDPAGVEYSTVCVINVMEG